MSAPVAGGAREGKGGAFEFTVSSPERCAVRGALTFATAKRARALGLNAQRAAAKSFVIDCGDILQADSAGLAVLLDWLAEAKRAGKALHFERLPDGLLRLARISSVDAMLQQGV